MAASYRTAATGAITGATVRPPVNGSGQQWPTMVNGGGQLWLMTVTDGGPPLTIAGSPTDHQSTTDQRWLTASQRPVASPLKGKASKNRPNKISRLLPTESITGVQKKELYVADLNKRSGHLSSKVMVDQDHKTNPLETRAMAWDEAECGKYMASQSLCFLQQQFKVWLGRNDAYGNHHCIKIKVIAVSVVPVVERHSNTENSPKVASSWTNPQPLKDQATMKTYPMLKMYASVERLKMYASVERLIGARI
ncbi:hypothetical protein Tco_0915347 [Tanacetum coccineum]